ncbi:MAG: NADP-dependent isocitrate dehydrogenase [Planctomycetota bacterium]
MTQADRTPTLPKTIIYTRTDEAPALATRSLLPILRAFTASSGLNFETRDISLAARVLAAFADRIESAEPIQDALAELGDLVKLPEANVIKLPNISASVPQLTAAIAELQQSGFAVPDFPTDPTSEEEKETRARYAKVLGSAVNPVLREGNSDRRVASPVKKFAQKNPHSMGAWSPESMTHVASMSDGDFYGNERSVVIDDDETLQIEFIADDGRVTVLKKEVAVAAGDVVDATFMSVNKLKTYIGESIDDAKASGLLLSLHLKATMMKVSDPILFGHVVATFYRELFESHGDVLADAGVRVNQGLGQILTCVAKLPDETRQTIEAAIATINADQPDLAMVDSDRGITNLHVPSDIIIDASMPAAIRAGGKMWDKAGQLRDTKAMIPDRSYAGVYQAVIDDCKANGTLDVSTMGSVSNVGLMAKKAEEYGSHDKTFEMPSKGKVRVVGNASGELMSHDVEAGDIWRSCQTKRVAIVDWVKLGVSRARLTGAPAVFWLDDGRAHDQQLKAIVDECLQLHDTSQLDIQVRSPVDATRHACARARQGLDTISVTGNVLRDYLTDLFPILELGTSAKMLSIVPLLAGGGMFETGAGGSAPKHVQQFVQEGHLRWDSLGEFLAVAVSLEDMSQKTGDSSLAVLAKTLNDATEKFLDENKSPSRKVGELDNRGSHFYLALYWAQALAKQETDSRLQAEFTPIANTMADQESAIVDELNAAQGGSVELGGYYFVDDKRADTAMRPSSSLNGILASMAST